LDYGPLIIFGSSERGFGEEVCLFLDSLRLRQERNGSFPADYKPNKGEAWPKIRTSKDEKK
jgi:hypothetical protein